MSECICDHMSVLGLLGAVVPVASGLSSFLNQMVRAKMEAKQEIPAWLLQACAVVNVIALNGDKVVQMMKASKKGGK